MPQSSIPTRQRGNHFPTNDNVFPEFDTAFSQSGTIFLGKFPVMPRGFQLSPWKISLTS
jgi:hypothetical protein